MSPKHSNFVDRLESWTDALRYHLSTGEHALALGDLTRIRALADVLSQDVWQAEERAARGELANAMARADEIIPRDGFDVPHGTEAIA